MVKRSMTLLLLVVFGILSCANAELTWSTAPEELERILAAYSEEETVLSDRIQVVLNNVNFRKIPGGEVLGRLQGGEMLECLDEVQYKGELWYHAHSEAYGDGYVIGTYAKPVWNNMNWWTESGERDVLSDNMLLFAYWMGTYQLDHGISVIETVGTDRQLSIAPFSVRGNNDLIPEDMKIQWVWKLYEFGLICRDKTYDLLMDPDVPNAEKNDLAAAVLRKHYGTEDPWEIIPLQSIALFIHVNDFHARPEFSKRDQLLDMALIKRLVSEH